MESLPLTAQHYNLRTLRNSPVVLNHLKEPSAWYLNTIDRFFNNLGVWVMPRKGQNAQNQLSWQQMEFVNFKLRQDESVEFNTWTAKLGEHGLDEIAGMMAEGYKLSIKWDSENVCFIASWTSSADMAVNTNMCMTSRSNDWYEAALMGVYKHKFIFGKTGWPRQGKDNNWG